MKRIVMILTVALVMAAMVVATAAPAFADKNNPLLGTDVTGDMSCSTHQVFNNGVNPQWHCAGNDRLP